MSKIACVLPDPSLEEQTLLAFQDKYKDIRIEIGLMEKGAKQAKVLAEEGFEVVISRGMTAFMIKEANPELSVVEIPFTALDIFQTIKRAQLYGNSIGVIAFSPMISGLDDFETMLSTSILFYPVEGENEVESKVLEGCVNLCHVCFKLFHNVS